jgi:hypothetical protein
LRSESIGAEEEELGVLREWARLWVAIWVGWAERAGEGFLAGAVEGSGEHGACCGEESAMDEKRCDGGSGDVWAGGVIASAAIREEDVIGWLICARPCLTLHFFL